MKVLVEGFPYNYHLLKKVIPDSFIQPTANPKSGIIRYVGYYRSERGLTTIILPKIFVNPNNSFIFGDIHYQELLESNRPLKSFLEVKGKSKQETKFISEFSLLIFRILKKFSNRVSNFPEHLKKSYANTITSNFLDKDISELDIILSLIRLHNENRFIYFRKKIVDRKQKDKIHWPKTIANNIPFVIDGIPYHLQTQQIMSKYVRDDPLLVLFYSTLKNISEEFGIKVELDEGLPIITGHSFQKLRGSAPRLLKQIKHVYFSDLHKEIIYLLRLYYGENLLYRQRKKKKEYFLTDNFYIVYEDMIDYILSDQGDILKYKFQKDGKILDHIYHDKSLVSDGDVYYIGDSKYYKEDSIISGISKYKQFTYAKNVIQMFIDAYESKDSRKTEIRDRITEGYNIIPNFFILPFINYNDFNDIRKLLDDEEPEFFDSLHFHNRLFDRDTFLAIGLKINLMVAMKLYISKNNTHISKTRHKIRAIIRNSLCKKINDIYHLYKIKHENLDNLIEKKFSILNGKIFRANTMGRDTALLALIKDEQFIVENRSILKLLIDSGIAHTNIDFT